VVVMMVMAVMVPGGECGRRGSYNEEQCNS
jgi:hypothetical protein